MNISRLGLASLQEWTQSHSSSGANIDKIQTTTSQSDSTMLLYFCITDSSVSIVWQFEWVGTWPFQMVHAFSLRGWFILIHKI